MATGCHLNGPTNELSITFKWAKNQHISEQFRSLLTNFQLFHPALLTWRFSLGLRKEVPKLNRVIAEPDYLESHTDDLKVRHKIRWLVLGKDKGIRKFSVLNKHSRPDTLEQTDYDIRKVQKPTELWRDQVADVQTIQRYV